MEMIQNIDAWLFSLINIGLANPVTDRLMPFITERDNWFIFYVLIWLYLFTKGGRTGRISAIMILLLILFSDQVSDNILKPLFARVRPCHVIPGANILANCSEAFSFPSNHAVNNFAAAAMFSHFYPKMKWFLYPGAAMVALSRVFCGVHYPFDIIGGALIGVAFAKLFIHAWEFAEAKLSRNDSAGGSPHKEETA